MALETDVTIEAVRRAHAAPREVTADRALLVGPILGPSLVVTAVLWTGPEAKTAELGKTIDAARLCAGPCAQADG